MIEIPRINDKFTGLQNRYAYAGRIHTASLSRDAQLKFDAVVKFDLVTGAKEVYEHGAGRYGMEAQFVPRFHPCTATSAERVLDPVQRRATKHQPKMTAGLFYLSTMKAMPVLILQRGVQNA